MLLLKRSVLVLLTALVACQGVIVNKSIKRTIDVTKHIVRSHIEISYLDDASDVQAYDVAIPLELDSRLSLITSKCDKSTCQVNKTKKDAKNGVQLYQVKLNDTVKKGTDATVKLTIYYTRVLIPYPAEVFQGDNQLVTFTSNHLVISPYETLTQSTKVKVPSGNVESYSLHDPVALKGSTIVYGPYSNTKAYSGEKDSLKLHFKNNSPFITITNLVKEIEVSMWGRVSIEEVYDLLHTGAVLKGGFSRFDYNHAQQHGASFRSLQAALPKESMNVYYRDQIGNITTSRLRETSSRKELELEARFPIFGGWKTQWYMGYSVPTTSVLFRTNKVYKLEVDFSTSLELAAVDDLTVKVILPEGATNIKVQLPFEIDNEEETTRQTYLDTPLVGRPVLILSKKNTIPQHNVPFQVSFEYPSSFIYREPLLLIGGFFTFFVVCMVFFRLDLSITSSKKSKTIKRD